MVLNKIILNTQNLCWHRYTTWKEFFCYATEKIWTNHRWIFACTSLSQKSSLACCRFAYYALILLCHLLHVASWTVHVFSRCRRWGMSQLLKTVRSPRVHRECCGYRWQMGIPPVLDWSLNTCLRSGTYIIIMLHEECVIFIGNNGI